MRRISIGFAALLMLVAGLVCAPPVAAANTVTIHRISVPELSPGATVAVGPRISRTGDVTVAKVRFTVWRLGAKKVRVGTRVLAGSRALAARKAAVRLGAGTYTVRTTVTFRVKKRSGGFYPGTTTRTRTQRLVIPTTYARCATVADSRRVRPGDTPVSVARTLHSPGRLDWSQVRSGGAVHEDWRYILCGNETQWVWVSYDNGRVSDVWVE